MPVQTCTIPYVRAELKSRIAALNLTYGDPTDPQAVGLSIGETPGGFKREHIIIGEVPESHSDQTWAALGFRTRDETYTLDVVIRVEVPGVDCDDAQAEAYRLLAAIETDLRAAGAVNLGLAADRGVIAVEVSIPSDVLVMTDEGAACAVKFSLRVKARLGTTS